MHIQLTGAIPFVSFGITISVRHSLHDLLEQNPDWQICSEAVDGADAIAKAQQCKPDIMILDFFMPGMTGVQAADVLGRLLPSVPTFIISLYMTAGLAAQAKNAGAKGTAQKSDTSQSWDGREMTVSRGAPIKKRRTAKGWSPPRIAVIRNLGKPS